MKYEVYLYIATFIGASISLFQFGFIKYNDYATTVWSIMDPQSESVGDLQTGFMAETYSGGWTNTIQGMEFATDMLTFDDRLVWYE